MNPFAARSPVAPMPGVVSAGTRPRFATGLGRRAGGIRGCGSRSISNAVAP